MKDRHLRDILNRRSNRWGNLTEKEFERDIALLKNTILGLEKHLKEEQDKTKLYINKWVSSTIDNIELMDEYIPEWRLSAKKEIKEIIGILKLK